MNRPLSLGFAVLAGMAVAGHAQARPDSRSMTCQQAQAMIGQSGAVVMSTGTHTYDRYVRSGMQCFSTGEMAVRSYIATSDNPSCVVYRCENVDPEDRRWMRLMN